MFAVRHAAELRYHTSPLLDAIGVPHAFSTRAGGVSPAPFDSLNLGIARDAAQKDSAANVEENYRRLVAAIGCAGRGRCWVSQVHAADVCTVRPGAPFANGPDADALVTDDPGRVVSIKYADCVPILLATADGRAVAAVHAGWRGLVAGVIGAAIHRLRQLHDAEVVAAVGPCIGQDAFEVGPEVAGEFRRVLGDRAPIRAGRANRFHPDLARATRMLLDDAGVTRIDAADQCTASNPGDYYSHRRDGAMTGRMACVIGPRHEAGAERGST
jgi:YfiH family protein